MMLLVWGLEKMKFRDMLEIAMIASAYFVLTIGFAPISYGPIQFRVSDILSTLPYTRQFGSKAVLGLTLGVLLANMISPYGIFDVVLGTISEFVALESLYLLSKTLLNWKIGLALGVLIEILTIVFFIGYLLLAVVYQVPLLLAVGGVAIGETVTIGIGGYLLATAIIKMYGR
jgi:uncharacterized membrane protein